MLDNINVSREHWRNDIDEGSTGDGGKGSGNLPHATSSNTNPTWTGMGSKPRLRGEISAIYCLSYSRVHNTLV